MDYSKAKKIRSQSLKDLIIDRTLNGEGFGKSISSSIKDKTKAKLTGLKEKFDPMNISRAVGGRLGAYAYGKLAGRSDKDMAYFAGVKNKTSSADASALTPVKNDPLVSKVSDGENRPIRKGEGLSTIMARIFNLLKRQILEEKKEREIAANFEEEQEDERQKRHEELVDALKNLGGGTATAENKGKSFLERMIEIVKKILAAVFLKLKPLLTVLKLIIKAIALGKDLSTLRSIASLAMAFPGVALAVALGTAAVSATNERDKRKADIERDPYQEKYLNDPRAMVARGEIKKESDAIEINRIKVTRQWKRTFVEGIVNGGQSEEQKKKILHVPDLEPVKEWLKAGGNAADTYQGEVTNDEGKLVILSGPTNKNLLVPKNNERSAKFVPPPVQARIIEVPGAGSDIIVGKEDVDNSVEPLPSPVPDPAAVAKAPAAVAKAPAAAAAAVVAKSSSTTASEAKAEALPADATKSAVKVTAEKSAPAAATAVSVSKPYREIAENIRVDSTISDETISNMKKSPGTFNWIKPDQMWTKDKKGSLDVIKIPEEKKDSNLSEVNQADKVKERLKQTEETEQRIKNMMLDSDKKSSLETNDNIITQMFQRIQKEFDGLMLASDSTKFKPTIIDASKSVATAGGGNLGTIFSTPVRTDDDTLKLILKKNTHSFA
jgi:hypothetical protein